MRSESGERFHRRQTMELRGYQVEAFKEITGWLAAGERDLLLESPVGSGKTNTVKAILAAQLAGRIRLAVVLVPQILLEKQWGSAGAWKVGSNTFTLPMAGKVAVADFTPAWLRTAAGVFVMTRQAFTKRAVTLDSLRGGSLSEVIVVADEGHHCADTTKGAQALAAARKRGAVTLLVSATPWATAGDVGPDAKAHRLPDAEYVTSFEADDPSRPPAEYAIDIVRVGKATSDPRLTIDDSTSARRAKGPVTAAEDAHARKICGAMAKRWASDGFPRTVMNVPRVFWRDHLHRALARAWKAVRGGTPEIVDLIGDEIDPVAHERLKADSEARRWTDVKVHAVLSCARMDEGLDWVPCSHVYNAGIPGVAGLILQRWGRAARGKRLIAGYPEEHAGARTLVFFTPPGKGNDKGWGKQIETAWILAGCLADYQVMRDWIEERKVRSERGPLPVPPTSPVVAEWTGRLSAHVAARGGEMAPADARAWLAAQKKPPEPAVIDAVVRRMQAADARHRAAEEARATGGLKVRADRKADAEPLIEEFEAPLRARVSSIINLTALDANLLAAGARQSHIETARKIVAWHQSHGAWPRASPGGRQKDSASDESKLGTALGHLRERHAETCVAFNIPLSGRTARDAIAIEITDYRNRYGRWPRGRNYFEDAEEKRLGKALNRLRIRNPEVCARHSIPLRADISALNRDRHAKTQLSGLAEMLPQACVHYRLTQTSPATDGCVGGMYIHSLLQCAHNRPGASRGLGRALDLCQISTLARLNAEIEADCWRFTLAGKQIRDTRRWSELLTSGDHKQIEQAERTHYLDWENPGPDGKPVKRVFKPKAGK